MRPPELDRDWPKGSPTFATTHWSVVLTAGPDAPEAAAALEELCKTYWYPLYAYVRRKGYDAHNAQDLTQEFFARLLEDNSLRSVDPSKGKFRSFLLASMNNLLAKEWRWEQAEKRGGGRAVISLDGVAAEERYKLEPADDQSPEKIFERRWAIALLERVLARVRAECSAANKAELFDQLKGMLSGEKDQQPRYQEVAARLDMTEAAVKQAARRLRQRYGEFLRMEIAQTVSDPNNPDEIDEEIRYLFRILQT